MSIPKHLDSLVEYEQPIEVNSQEELERLKALGSQGGTQGKKTAEEIIRSILAPQEWDQDGKHFVQFVSPQIASREDMKDYCDVKPSNCLFIFSDVYFRESGICPIREELHSQCFDEIIRQVTLDCADRGLLLMRVRDELKMTIAAYQTLFESSVTFGMRKQLQAEQGMDELETRVKELEDKKSVLTDKRTELENKIKAMEKRFKERRDILEQKRTKEKEFLTYQNSHLDQFLTRLEQNENEK